jgi:hypothetical protein
MNDEKPARATLEDIFAKLEQTSYRELLHDHERRRHLLATLMADSTDPIMREMGEQLRDGSATPRQLLSVPDYLEVLNRGYDELAKIDLDEVAEWVDDVERREREDAERERDGRPEV